MEIPVHIKPASPHKPFTVGDGQIGRSRRKTNLDTLKTFISKAKHI